MPGPEAYPPTPKISTTRLPNQIAQELRGQYLPSYTPDQAGNDGGYHKIALKVKRDDVAVVTREGYYAPGGDSR